MKGAPTLYTARFLAAALVVLIGGCVAQPEQDQAAVAAEVNNIWKEYSASLSAGDIERWLALWTEDGIQMPPNEPAIVGRDRIRARNRAVLDQFTFDMTITNEEVGVARDLAFARGTYKATLSPKRGGDAVPIDGKYMSILARQSDGSWKIRRDIFNSNVAAGQ